ncbi:MAG: cell division protein FtsL [Giesbergeria sp.]
MSRWNVLLFVLVLGSALYLVHTQYESRQLYTALDRAVSETHQLDTEHDRLQVEKRAQATPLRVESLARGQLKMRPATPAITRYIAQPEGVATEHAAAPDGASVAASGARP